MMVLWSEVVTVKRNGEEAVLFETDFEGGSITV